MYYTQKVTQYPNSKKKIGQVLASCLVISCLQNFFINSIIIDFKETNDFFYKRDLYIIYMEYEHKFWTKTGEKTAAYGYSNIDLSLSDHEGNITILTITKVSWAP